MIFYKQGINKSVKIRWLSSDVAVTRIADMYVTLKCYFLFQQKCPRILISFSEVFLLAFFCLKH